MTLYHFLDFCIDYSYMNLLKILSKTTLTQTKNQPVTYKPRSHKKRLSPPIIIIYLISYEIIMGIMLRHMGWTEAADFIIKGMDGAKLLKCSEFGDAIIKHM